MASLPLWTSMKAWHWSVGFQQAGVLVTSELLIPIVTEVDIVTARQRGRALAVELGFPSSDQALIATAISELARNIIHYANRGQVEITVEHNGGRTGIGVVAT